MDDHDFEYEPRSPIGGSSATEDIGGASSARGSGDAESTDAATAREEIVGVAPREETAPREEIGDVDATPQILDGPHVGGQQITDGDSSSDVAPVDPTEEAEQGVIASSRPRTARERRIYKQRLTQSSTETQATTGVEDHRNFDVSKALSALRSPDAKIRRQALQRLRLRWWHATITEMRRTLAVSGAPSNALAEIASVVQACKICRGWQVPSPKSQLAVRLILNFNDEVQADLVFIKSRMELARGLITILHIIDVCTRFAQPAATVDNGGSKTEEILTEMLSRQWIAIFGAPILLVIDGETAMRGAYTMDWAAAVGTTLKIKAPRQKAWIIERHNAPLRATVHTTEDQLSKEGTHVNFDVVLSICVFSLNAMSVINSSTPYNAVLGRQRPICYRHFKEDFRIRRAADSTGVQRREQKTVV